MSIYGHIRCNFVTGFKNTYEPKNFNIIDGIGPSIFLSKDSLLPVINTEAEKDLFDFIIDKLNQTTVTFIMKAGGDYFDNEIRQQASERTQLASSAIETMRWNDAAQKLGLYPDFVERCIDKDSIWVAEFFTKLYYYAK